MRVLAPSHVLPAELLQAMDARLGAAITAAVGIAGDALAESTRRNHARGWAHFAAWCRTQDADPDAMPVHPVLIAAYVGHLAPTLGISALNVRVAAIAHEHRRRGHTWNGRHPAIRETLQGARRKFHREVRATAALCSDEVKQLLSVCPADLAGPRDRALCLVGLAGAFRRSELVAIDWTHPRVQAAHMVVHVPRSKRDQEGNGADVTIPRDA